MADELRRLRENLAAHPAALPPDHRYTTPLSRHDAVPSSCAPRPLRMRPAVVMSVALLIAVVVYLYPPVVASLRKGRDARGADDENDPLFQAL